MSCKNCDSEPIKGAYYRWKNATIEIIACEEHFLEITEVLNFGQKIKDEYYSKGYRKGREVEKHITNINKQNKYGRRTNSLLNLWKGKR